MNEKMTRLYANYDTITVINKRIFLNFKIIVVLNHLNLIQF